jgi:predicted nucleic acid-binding protein
VTGADRALICDTSGVLAALDRSDPDHRACALALVEHPGSLVLSPLVLAELDHLVRRRLGAAAARQLADDVANGAYDLIALRPADIAECVALDRRYADLGLGLTDASLAVLALRHQTRELLSLDERHLRAIVPLQGGIFRLLPMDRE